MSDQRDDGEVKGKREMKEEIPWELRVSFPGHD